MSADPQTESRLARFETVLEHIKDQVDRLAGLVTTVTEVQMQQRTDREALDRAYERIRGLETHVSDLERQKNEANAAIHDEIGVLRTKLRVYVATATGACVGATIVWGAIAWFLKNDVVSILRSIAEATGG